jgi:hypothetical protein
MLKNNARLSQEKKPKLAAAGAGIPWYQLLMLRFIVSPFVAAKTDWSVSEKRFKKITTKILKEIDGLTDAQLTTKVLVPPQMGLEDSSRYWSIAMALEHLVIVGKVISVGIRELSSGRIPDYKPDTAAVKPFGTMAAQQARNEFTHFAVEEFPQLLPSLVNRHSNLKLNHPWFGGFKAQQWYWLLATHHALHLKQIREIKKGLHLD